MGSGVSHNLDTQAYVTCLRLDPCSYCGAPPPSTIDHIDPRRGPDGRRGGSSWRNLTAACLVCNRTKGNAPLLVFLRGALW